jgi:hypothetical protein
MVSVDDENEDEDDVASVLRACFSQRAEFMCSLEGRDATRSISLVDGEFDDVDPTPSITTASDDDPALMQKK